MKTILALDTTTRDNSIALRHNNNDFFSTAEIHRPSASATLMPRILGLLSEQGLRLQDLTALVAVTGPGSFTGIRIGLSTVNALCLALRIPAAGPHVFELMAFEAGKTTGPLCAIRDAGHGHAYYGFFESAQTQKAEMGFASLETLKQRYPENKVQWLTQTPQASTVLAWAQEHTWADCPVGQSLQPLYLLKSQAERLLS